MTADPTTAEAIQQQMRQVRAEMREDVQVMVENARDMSDWTWYVRTYPWVCVGAAAAVGFLVIPSRSPQMKPDTKDLLELAKREKIVVKVEDPKSAGPSLLGTLLRMAAGSLLQGGLAIVTQQIDQYLKRPGAPRAPSSNGNGQGAHHG
jgi:hypothetical protein